MCNQATNVPSVTLQTAVLMQVKEFAQSQQSFSVHDITRNIRSKTGSGEIEIPEVEVSGASFRYDIPHVKVKQNFDEMWRTGVFDPFFTLNRQFNGQYFVYTPSVASGAPAPTPVPVTAYVQTPSKTGTSSGKVSQSEVQTRVETYLDNCLDRNFRPTLKQVQSAIKRGNASTGWTCGELSDLIENELGHSIVVDPEYLSASQVAI